MRSFKSFALVYLPVAIPGWIISAAAVAFCLHIFLYVDGRSHSGSDTLYGIFPDWLPTFLLWIWIASRTNADGPPRNAD